jgi:hypothetical protein
MGHIQSDESVKEGTEQLNNKIHWHAEITTDETGQNCYSSTQTKNKEIENKNSKNSAKKNITKQNL